MALTPILWSWDFRYFRLARLRTAIFARTSMPLPGDAPLFRGITGGTGVR
jgi:hypothetical protein